MNVSESEYYFLIYLPRLSPPGLLYYAENVLQHVVFTQNVVLEQISKYPANEVLKIP